MLSGNVLFTFKNDLKDNDFLRPDIHVGYGNFHFVMLQNEINESKWSVTMVFPQYFIVYYIFICMCSQIYELKALPKIYLFIYL